MAWAAAARIEGLVEAHYATLYRYAFRLAGSATEAEDLTQETYCQAQAKLGQLRDWNRARGWLFAILRNAYLHRIRGRKLEKLVPPELLHEVPEATEVSWPEVSSEQLQKALNELPEVYRTPIILYFFEDFSYRDIAEHMEAPLGTVMSRLARAKAFLRAKLAAPVLAPLREEEA